MEPKMGFLRYIPSIMYAISPDLPPLTCISSIPRSSWSGTDFVRLSTFTTPDCRVYNSLRSLMGKDWMASLSTVIFLDVVPFSTSGRVPTTSTSSPSTNCSGNLKLSQTVWSMTTLTEVMVIFLYPIIWTTTSYSPTGMFKMI